jgi:hypothetical protein
VKVGAVGWDGLRFAYSDITVITSILVHVEGGHIQYSFISDELYVCPAILRSKGNNVQRADYLLILCGLSP